METNVCAPHKYDRENNTCFTLDQLVEMASAYNRYLTKNKLNPNPKPHFENAKLIDIKSNKKYLLLEFKKRFEKICNNDEICLTRQAFMNHIVKEMKEDIINNTFRPKGPNDPKEWLSTYDINNIMAQYEKIYPKFGYFGAVPLNCNELTFCSLYKLDFDQYAKNGTEQFGIIFNLDRHGEAGSHWVAMFIDIINGEIYFCDSNGKPPIDNILSIIKQFTDYYKNKTGKNATYQYNTVPYQKDSSECGIYSCNFLIRKLAGETFDEIVNNPLSFQEINSCRNVYFRNTSSKFPAHSKCDPKLNHI
jgi:hypothetical protein